MLRRVLTTSAVCLVVLGASATAYLSWNSLFGSATSVRIGESGAEAERKPLAPSLPTKPPNSGSPISAPATDSGQLAAHISSDERVDSLGWPTQQKQDVGGSADEARLNARPERSA